VALRTTFTKSLRRISNDKGCLSVTADARTLPPFPRPDMIEYEKQETMRVRNEAGIVTVGDEGRD
jgi:hypothetical protein